MELTKTIVNDLVNFVLENLEDTRAYSLLEKNFLKRAVKKSILEEKAILRKLVDGKIDFDPRRKEFKQLLKSSKSFIRELTNAFLNGKIITKYEKLKDLLEDKPIETAHLLLKEHTSTRERYEDYKEIYYKIFKEVGVVNSLVDIGCGLNPLSFIFFKDYVGKDFTYYGNEILLPLVELNNTFFKVMGIKGNIEFKDTFDYKLRKANMYFLFKVLDSLESVEFDFTKKFLPRIPAKFIVISFPKQNLSGKVKIREHKRKWFFKILDENGWHYNRFDTENEMFFIVKKN